MVTKKLISLLLSAILVLSSLSGCSSRETAQKDSSTQAKEENKTETKKEQTEKHVSSTDNLENSGISPIAIGVTKYMEVKGKAYEMLTPMTDSISQKDPLASMSLLSLLVTDITLLPLTFVGTLLPIGQNVWEGPLIMMDGKGKVEQKGDICIFEMEVESKENPGEILTITGEYDAKKDSLQAIYHTNGKETIIFEFIASGDGYVSQFYSTDNEGNALIKQAFNEKSLYAGMISDSGKPESIYKQAINIGEDFVKNDTLMVVLQDGQGYSIIEGKKFEY